MDANALRNYLKKNKIKTVIHTAVKGGDQVLENILRMFMSIYNNLDLLDKFINFGSGAEYAKTRDIIKVKEKDGEMFLRYFVLIPNKDNYDTYEWNYLDPKKFKNTQLGPSFMDQIHTLTTWNFSFKNLDDKEFWDKYLLVKSNGEFKYLAERK